MCYIFNYLIKQIYYLNQQYQYYFNSNNLNLNQMHHQEQANSICASFSDFCSVGERVQGNREQLLTRENQRLRREYSEVSEKYMKMCNELTKTQKKIMDKERKISELDLFYKRQIETLKKQLSAKNNQISKLTKVKNRKTGQSNKENQCQNLQQSQYLQNCLENQSMLMIKLQQQNQRLQKVLSQVMQIFQPYIKTKQNLEVCRRVSQLKRELNQKINISGVLEKSNDIINDLRKGADNDGQLPRLISILKSKTNQLRKTPVIFDYDLKTQSSSLQVLFTDLDIQMRMQKCKKSEFY